MTDEQFRQIMTALIFIIVELIPVVVVTVTWFVKGNGHDR